MGGVVKLTKGGKQQAMVLGPLKGAIALKLARQRPCRVDAAETSRREWGSNPLRRREQKYHSNYVGRYYSWRNLLGLLPIPEFVAFPR